VTEWMYVPFMNINRICLQWFPFKASGQLHLSVLLIIKEVFEIH